MGISLRSGGIALLVAAALAQTAPGQGRAQEDPVALARQTAAEAISKRLRGTRGADRVSLSRPRQTQSGIRFCATTEAYNASGFSIGLTYWQVDVAPDGTTLQGLQDVTGLFSDCYSDSYAPYRAPPAAVTD